MNYTTKKAMNMLASSEAGFVFAVLGTVSQTAHTWFIAIEFSSFTGITAVLQAAFLSLFLSGGLLFYIIRTGSAVGEVQKMHYNRIANAFMAMEIFINLYYWMQRLVFVPWFVDNDYGGVLWYKLIIAVPFAILIPVILKTYGGEIKLDREMVVVTDKYGDRIKGLEAELKSFREDSKRMVIEEVDVENKEYAIRFKN
jgi:cellulose synthase/poly-beta-1,6-N-acetylglucosamine synthase-like glycosyltransferase